MTLVCPRCQAQNADGARFCRACGTPLDDAAPPPADTSAEGVACDDCGHVNAPGTRYCAKCGYSLVGTVIVSKRDSTYGGLQGLTAAATPAEPAPPAPPTPATPPPPPAPPSWMAPPPVRTPRIDEDTDTFDPLSAPTQVMHTGAEAHGASGARPSAEPFTGAAPTSRTGLYVVGGLIALAVVAGAGWWLMKPSAAPSETAAAPATPPAPEPVVPPPAPAPTAAAEPPVPATAPPPVAAAPEPAPTAQVAPAAPTAPPVQPPAPVQATAVPAATPPAAVTPVDREIARKAAREKAAREREARAKAAAEAREQELARQRAAQTAARPAATAAAPVAPVAPAAPAPLPTVKEMCGGRNLISQGLCEQRECRKAEHAGEALCKQLKEAEERRLYQ